MLMPLSAMPVSGRWRKRAALVVAALKAGQKPHLFPGQDLSARAPVAYTPAAAPSQRTQPNFGDAGDVKQVNQIEADILNAAAKRAGLSLTAESFAAAAKAKNKSNRRR